MPRVRLDDPPSSEEEDGGNYFSDQQSPLEFISSGAAVLNCTIGGGWPLKRISNVVGDSSTGKTLLAIEASANFAREYKKGRIFYRESESAFDEDYAAALGMPIDRVEFIAPEDFVTVEDFYDDLCLVCDECEKDDAAGLYVCDSLDALSDKGEQGRKFGEDSYGTGKAKEMGKLLRMCRARVAKSRVHLMIISQTRQKIGAMFAQKTRSGGEALNFYASQVLWLSHLGDIKREKGKVERVTGLRIRARCTKNKIALPRREAEFTITFGHGIDSLASSLDWLDDVGKLAEAFPDETISKNWRSTTYRRRLAAMSDEDYWDECRRVDENVIRLWREVEADFLDGVRPKYRD